MQKNLKFEVCCGSAQDALAAARGGADRIELNAALFLGGLTPTLGALDRVKAQTEVPVMAMVRPREGGFCYTDEEYRTLLADARLLLAHGADGLVFGFLQADGSLDSRRISELVALCGDKEAVFSRAVDLCPDPLEAVEQLRQLGVRRVLSSGAKPTALEGAEMLRRMVALGGIEILPGAGIHQGNVRQLLQITGASQVHASARKVCCDPSARGRPEIFFGGNIDGRWLPEDAYKVTDAQAVAQMKNLLNGVDADEQ